ncbi:MULTISPECIES: flagellar hook assembly protein FlgD [Kordiimonas]|jgi:flagellar basal-body rod modification protein FlgD|uniref:flagellar hook assembly protein FlgD n=1 Tax=Kordiimonas TaxID=288021 RepID=UPI00257DF627|nr:flagellar hook capping FlgD N-terminal domain-containing protein [Kordiimonas sp. UBA4487]
MVDLTGITSATGTGTTRGDNSATKLADDFDDFLTLLTTQLQNQDPTDPMDSNEFTNQLVQFSSVEQQIQTNQNLESLQSLLEMNNIASAATFLGSDALIMGNKGDHDGSSGITWQYQNTAATEDLTVQVRNETGTLVYSEAGSTSLGLHTFDWAGIDTAGNPVAPGEYTLNISATNADGAALSPPIAVRDTITAVDTSGLEPIFTVGPNEVGQSDILQLVHRN